MEVSFRLPLDVAGWSWDQDFVTSSVIQDGIRYENNEVRPSARRGVRGIPSRRCATGWRPSRWRCRWVPRCSGSATTRHGGCARSGISGFPRRRRRRNRRRPGPSGSTRVRPSGVFGRRRRSSTRWTHRASRRPLKLQGAWALPGSGRVPFAGYRLSGFRLGSRRGRSGSRTSTSPIRTGSCRYHYVNPMNWWRQFAGYTQQPSYNVIDFGVELRRGVGDGVDGGRDSDQGDGAGGHQLVSLQRAAGSTTLPVLPISGTAATCRAIPSPRTRHSGSEHVERDQEVQRRCTGQHVGEPGQPSGRDLSGQSDVPVLEPREPPASALGLQRHPSDVLLQDPQGHAVHGVLSLGVLPLSSRAIWAARG